MPMHHTLKNSILLFGEDFASKLKKKDVFNTKHDDTKYNVIKILYQYTVNYDKMGSQTLQLKALNISITLIGSI